MVDAPHSHGAAVTGTIAGVVGLVHGLAHGAAFAGAAALLPAGIGLLAGSAVLLAGGVVLARTVDRWWTPRLVGATAALGGLVMLLGMAGA